MLTLATALLMHVLSATCQAPAFNITAISAKNQASRLECWQLDSEPMLGRGAVNFALGSFNGSFVGIIPPHTSSGTLSNAAMVQYSLIMAGEVHITTPNANPPAKRNEVCIQGGRYGWLIAADTADVAAKGHVTEFPSDESTVIAQFPVEGNKVPKHKVLHDGPCTEEQGDFVGL